MPLLERFLSFRPLALRPKLILAFSGMAVLAGLCGTVGLAFVDRIGATVSTLSEVTSPLLTESLALFDNAVRMRSTVFRGLTEGREIEQVSEDLSKLEAIGNVHLQNLRDLATQAGIGIRLEVIEQNKRDYIRTLEAMISSSARGRKLSVVTKERLADFDLKHGALRKSIIALANRAESQLSAAEDQVKVDVQTGKTTVDELGALVSTLLTEVYPVLQNANKLLQQTEQLDEVAKLIMAQASADDLAVIDQEIDAEVADLSGRLRGAERQADLADIRQSVANLRAAVVGVDGLLTQRREALVAETELANSRATIAAIERIYSGVLNEMEHTVRGLNRDASERTERGIMQARTIVAATIVLTILAALLFGYLIANRITRPLARLTAHVAGIREHGELTPLTEPMTIGRTDEIGTLSRSFNLMITELAEARKRLIAWSEQEIRTQYERLDAAVNNMPQGLCMFDRDKKLIVCNRPYAEMYGLKPEQIVPGTPVGEILQQRVAVGGYPDNDEGYVANRLKAIEERKPFYVVNELADGHVVAVSQMPMSNGGWIATHEDITDRRKAEAQIAFLAHHDALTRLPNRLRLREEMDKALSRVERGETLAVLCLDLDHFKEVNDTLGHPIGDALLQAVSERIRSQLRPSDTIARLGGDEFAVLQVSGDQPEGATALAARLIKDIGEAFDIQGHQVVIGTSIGIAVAPGDGNDPDTLLKHADMALYRAKEDGRGISRFFEPEMDAKMQARRKLELDLRKALALQEFELFYQPLVNLQSDKISGFEALLRWHHPERGLVAPATFIPLAEEIGLIGPIGAWVLKQACSEAANWPSHIKIAVNLSPVQFKNGTVVLDVISALGASGLAASRLELEITETTLLQDTDATVATLNQLRDLGARISMDDFGTGYSSLGYLRKFPFDKIKIDQSFIRDLSDKPDSIAIVRAVTGLGSSLGMCTTAEGVETAEQLQRLRSERCTEVQGYLISKPRPANELADLLQQARHPSWQAAA